MRNIDKTEFTLHMKYIHGPIGSDYINVLLPINTEFFVGDSKFIVVEHEIVSVLEENVELWTIEMIALEVENRVDIYNQIIRDTLLEKLL